MDPPARPSPHAQTAPPAANFSAAKGRRRCPGHRPYPKQQGHGLQPSIGGGTPAAWRYCSSSGVRHSSETCALGRRLRHQAHGASHWGKPVFAEVRGMLCTKSL
eukprot:2655093-Prymnesium_polylepis.1